MLPQYHMFICVVFIHSKCDLKIRPEVHSLTQFYLRKNLLWVTVYLMHKHGPYILLCSCNAQVFGPVMHKVGLVEMGFSLYH